MISKHCFVQKTRAYNHDTQTQKERKNNVKNIFNLIQEPGNHFKTVS